MKNPLSVVVEAAKIVSSAVFLFSMGGALQVVQLSSILLCPISERWAAQINCSIVGSVWWVMQYIFERRQKARITFSGDRIPCSESAIVISNHQSWTDFYMLHAVAIRRKMLSNCKYFVKDSMKWLPFFGWGMWIAGFIFVRRDWVHDQSRIKGTFAAIKRCRLPVWIISFVEGTRMSPQKLYDSQNIARKNGYPIMHHVLLPRIKGFATCIQESRNSHVNYVYDFTLAYRNTQTGSCVAPDMIRIHKKALYPEYQFHIHVKRYALQDLPRDNEELAAWLRQRYIEKDAYLSQLKRHWTAGQDVWEEPMP